MRARLLGRVARDDAALHELRLALRRELLVFGVGRVARELRFRLREQRLVAREVRVGLRKGRLERPAIEREQLLPLPDAVAFLKSDVEVAGVENLTEFCVNSAQDLVLVEARTNGLADFGEQFVFLRTALGVVHHDVIFQRQADLQR